MAAGKYSFSIEQGSTVKFDVAYKDSSNNPIDLTGYQGRMQIKNTAGGSVTHLTLSSSFASSSEVGIFACFDIISSPYLSLFRYHILIF